MNIISIEINIPDKKLRETIFSTIVIETAATKTDRGEAKLELTEKGIHLTIEAHDVVATRAITNSILRLVQTSVDVVQSIQ